MSEKIGERIHRLRKNRSLTLEQVANAVGVGKSTVRKWETGMIANMKRDKIIKLAKALGTTPDYIMGWNDEEFVVTPIIKNEKQTDDTNKSALDLFNRALIAAETAIYIFYEDAKNAISNKYGCLGPIPVEYPTDTNQSVHIMTESEKKMLDLFQQIPENKQQTMLSIMKVFVDSCRPEDSSEEA